MSFDNAGKNQRYKAIVELTWSSEVFEDDPDDVFQLAELEQAFLISVMESAALALNPEDADFTVVSVKPELDS